MPGKPVASTTNPVLRGGVTIHATRLTHEHLQDAATLFAAQYREQRLHTPLLPARHADATSILPKLERLLDAGIGAAAIDAGHLVGFILSTGPISDFKGTQRGVYCPEWAHAAAGGDRRRVYQCLYEWIAERWVANGCLTHALTILADDDEAVDTWFHSTFGMLVIDAVRGLDPVPSELPADVEIRRAGAADVGLILPLAEALKRYAATAPYYMPFIEAPEHDQLEQWLAEPGNACWLATYRGEPAAYIGAEPSYEDACYVIRDPKTISITKAFTLAPLRRLGLATCLLNEVLSWARAGGMDRCSVDFEASNVHGSRFWLRYFAPVCYSLIRYVDERVLWASGGRSPASLWLPE